MSTRAASILPKAAVALLQRAASTPNDSHDQLAKTKALEKAIKRVKREYPNFFKEQHDESET